MDNGSSVAFDFKFGAADFAPDASNMLVRKLGSVVALSAADKAALAQISTSARMVEPDVDLINEGEALRYAIVVLEGFACRYKQRRTGQRQILAYLLPGDLCDGDVPYRSSMDHAVGTLSSCRVARLGQDVLAELIDRRPVIAEALRLSKRAEIATAREWVVNLGCRSASERMAHLFCELLVRLEAVGLVRDNTYALPLTQRDLANTLGLSNVHVNRTLQELRRQKLLELRGRTLRLLDLPRLRSLGEFAPAYLRPGSCPTQYVS